MSRSRTGLSCAMGMCVISFSAVRGAAEPARGGPRIGRPAVGGAVHGPHSTIPSLCRIRGGPRIGRTAVGGPLHGTHSTVPSVPSVSGGLLPDRPPPCGLRRGACPLLCSPLLACFRERAPGDSGLSRSLRHIHVGSVARNAVRSASFVLSAMA